MTNFLIKSLIFGIFFLANSSAATEYRLDSSHSRIGFKVKHLRFWVQGSFNLVSGHASYDPKTGLIDRMKVDIAASSINTNEKDRDRHLRSADFLWADKYKNITFAAYRFEYSGKKKKRLKVIHGQLTVRGVVQPVSLEVKCFGVATDPWGKERLGFEARGKLDRRKFGLTWNKGLKKAVSHLFVGNEVLLEIQVQAIS